MRYCNLKTKKADSKLLSAWWFFIITIVATAVVVATLLFFSDKIDVRFEESDSLVNRVFNCLIEEGRIREDFFDKDFDLFKSCNLNKNLIDSEFYYLKLELLDVSDSKNVRESLEFGNRAFLEDCKIGAAMKNADRYPRCSEKAIRVLSNSFEDLKLIVIGGSNNEFRQ